jgi:putative transposase
MKENSEKLICKLCGSTNTIRFGRYRGIQRWWCKDCHHKFAGNDALPEMRSPYNQVAAAIDMYFEGMRLTSIPGLLFRRYGTFITSASVYRWITRFSQLAVETARDVSVSVGDAWIIIETASRNDIRDIKLSLMDIIDVETHFLLATSLCHNRNQYDVEELIKAARERAGKSPKEVLTDGWKGYRHGITLAQEENRCKIMVSVFDANRYLDLINCWLRASNSRTKIIKSLKKKEAAQLILDGWSIHYNYVRPQELLNGKTPGKAAAAGYKFHDWLEIVHINQNFSKH